MNKRLRKARRVLAVQTVLDRLADWRLRDLETRERILADRWAELVAFLDQELALSGVFASTAMRRMQGLENLRMALIAEKDALARRRLEERRRKRAAGQIVDAVEAEARRMEEARQLGEAMERSVDRRG